MTSRLSKRVERLEERAQAAPEPYPFNRKTDAEILTDILAVNGHPHSPEFVAERLALPTDEFAAWLDATFGPLEDAA
jgi:hypothetical protein